MNKPQQPLPELEIQLISRQAARRQAAIEVLRTEPFRPRWAWGLGSAAFWVLAVIGVMRYGDGFAAYLGLTDRGLIWICGILAAFQLPVCQVYALDRRVKALTDLILDESKSSPSGVSASDARSS